MAQFQYRLLVADRVAVVLELVHRLDLRELPIKAAQVVTDFVRIQSSQAAAQAAAVAVLVLQVLAHRVAEMMLQLAQVVTESRRLSLERQLLMAAVVVVEQIAAQTQDLEQVQQAAQAAAVRVDLRQVHRLTEQVAQRTQAAAAVVVATGARQILTAKVDRVVLES
jgi:hypothetical protein